MPKILDYLRQPTTLIGLSLTIGALVGNTLGAISSDITITMLAAATPLWAPENDRAKIAAIEAAVVPATHGIASTGKSK